MTSQIHSLSPRSLSPIQDEPCAICLEPLGNKKEVAFHAGGEKHPMHKVCFVQWLSSSKRECPICREVVHIPLPRHRVRHRRRAHSQARDWASAFLMVPRREVPSFLQNCFQNALGGGLGGAFSSFTLTCSARAIAQIASAAAQGTHWATSLLEIDRFAREVMGIGVLMAAKASEHTFYINFADMPELEELGILTEIVIGTSLFLGMGYFISKATHANPARVWAGMAGASASCLCRKVTTQSLGAISLIGGIVGATIAGGMAYVCPDFPDWRYL